MAALGTEVMGLPLSIRAPWAASEVILIAPSMSPVSTSENGKSAAANVLTLPFLVSAEAPVEVGRSFNGVTFNINDAARLQRLFAFLALNPIDA